MIWPGEGNASACRYVQMAAHRLARASGELSAAEEGERLVALFAAELADATRFATLWRRDRRLLDNPNIRLAPFLQACMPWRPIDSRDPFVTKLAHTEQMLAALQERGALDAVPSDLVPKRNPIG